MSEDRVNTSKCAICKVLRQEVNHWFLLTVDGATPKANETGVSAFNWRGLVQVVEWNEEMAQLEGWRAVCGEGHLLQLMSRWISHGTLDDPKSPLSQAVRKES